jgi:hypothetical protein
MVMVWRIQTEHSGGVLSLFQDVWASGGKIHTAGVIQEVGDRMIWRLLHSPDVWARV